MSAATVDDLVDRIRALPAADREQLERRLRDDRNEVPPPERPVQQSPGRATTVAEVAGMLRPFIPPDRLGATDKQWRDAITLGWVEREMRFRADNGLPPIEPLLDPEGDDNSDDDV